MAATSPGFSSTSPRLRRFPRGAGADRAGADEPPRPVAAGRPPPLLLLPLPPPLAVRPRRERRQVRPVQPLPPPHLRDVEGEHPPLFGVERLGESSRPR